MTNTFSNLHEEVNELELSSRKFARWDNTKRQKHITLSLKNLLIYLQHL